MSAVVERIDPPAVPQILASGGEDRPLPFDANGGRWQPDRAGYQHFS